LLSYIIEKVRRLSYCNYLKKNIFDPLDMKSYGICFEENKKMYDVKGYYSIPELNINFDISEKP
jgi:CubicO group peptidase (beta-lactamase class C family)